MVNTYNNNCAGIKLGELKDRIYKALFEYSVNGEETGVLNFDKADMEKSILTAINTSVTKAVQHLPVFTRAMELYFPQIKTLFYKDNTELKKGETLCFDIQNTSGRVALKIGHSGKVSVKLTSDNKTVSENEVSCGLYGEIKKSGFVFDSERPIRVCITALEGGAYIDSVLCVDASNLGDISDASVLPEYGKTFAKVCDNIQKVTYAASDGKSIPVHEYDFADGYVYTSCGNSGKNVIHYIPTPAVFTQDSNEDELLSLPEITVCAIVYLAASELCPVSDSDAYNRLAYKYRDIALNCYNREHQSRRNSFYSTSRETLSLGR